MAQTTSPPDLPSASPAPAELERGPRHDDGTSAIRRFASSPAVRESLAVFILTRVLFILLTYFGVILFHNALHDPTHPSFLHQLLPAWEQRWDEAWYVDIARRGYAWHKAVGTYPTVFFPLYPLLIRVLATVTHRSYDLAGIVLSNLCFLVALWYLRRLAQWELDRDVSSRTILYVATFPTALFFFAGYSESLYLLLAVACFYHLRRREWLLAGVFGGLASATRVTGVLLLLPMAYEYARSHNFSPRQMIRPGAIELLLVPAGLAAFMVYLQLTVGDALAFTHHQAAWQKIFTLRLWAGFLESLRQIFVVQPPASFFQAHNVIEVTLGGLFLVLTFFAARRLPASYSLYTVAFWLVTLSSPAMAGGYPVPLISLSRYILALFPVFMYLGILGARRSFNDAYLVLSTGILSLLTIQFITGGWVI